jgi:hypothetical protein
LWHVLGHTADRCRQLHAERLHVLHKLALQQALGASTHARTHARTHTRTCTVHTTVHYLRSAQLRERMRAAGKPRNGAQRTRHPGRANVLAIRSSRRCQSFP